MNGSEKIEKLIIKDYRGAVVNLIWTMQKIDNQIRRELVFMSMEFYPCELRAYFLTDEDRVRIKNTDIWFYHERLRLDVEKALSVYKSLDTGKISLPNMDQGKLAGEKIIYTKPFCEMPQWPEFYVSKKTDFSPFIPDWCGTCRTHHKLAKEKDKDLLDLLNHSNVANWLKEKLLWNITEYPEFIGSSHVILPNPLYRELSLKLADDETIYGYFLNRENVDIAECHLHIYTTEKGVFGTLKHNSMDITSNFIEINTSGTVDTFGYIVTADRYGILDYSGYNGFIKQIKIDMGLITKSRKVSIDDNEKTCYKTNVVTENSQILLGKECKELELGEKLNKRYSDIVKKRQAEKTGQIIFKAGEEKVAQEYIRALIGKAKKSLCIVDPYFSTIELYKFVLAIEKENLPIEIVTSAKVLRYKEKLNNGEEKCKGYYLKKEIDNIKPDTKLNIAVRVMEGKEPNIHDRFLVIDDTVYFSGNSLNHIGEKTSMIIKVDYAEEIISLIKQEKCDELDQWVEKHEKNQKKGQGS